MLIGITLGIMIVLVFFSFILGGNFIEGSIELAVDATAIIDGVPQTFETLPVEVLVSIDTTGILGAIIVISGVMIALALLIGISFISSGINPQAGKIVIIASTYIAIWTLFSIISAPLIQSIEVFGFIIYIIITLGYVVGVVQSIVGND